MTIGFVVILCGLAIFGSPAHKVLLIVSTILIDFYNELSTSTVERITKHKTDSNMNILNDLLYNLLLKVEKYRLFYSNNNA